MIVGGGPAGDAVAAGLRDAGFVGEIVLVGAEPVRPYERPHLSKGFLLGTVPLERLGLRPAEQYRDLGVELQLGQRVVDLGVTRHEAELEDGTKLAWDLLCIATGSSARRLAGFEDAMYLRELPDAVELRAVLERGDDLSVIGAGFIGCEVAAAARQRGCEVSMYEALDQPLARVLGPEVGAYLADVHRSQGVELHLKVTTLPELQGPVVGGVGSVPRMELAQRAGVLVDEWPGIGAYTGIRVDSFGHTSTPGVFAAGDVTRFMSGRYQARIRVEHFQTSQRHGFAVGRVMAGASEPYDEVPWFWSDQYGLNIQYAGAGLAWDEILVRGTLGVPPFSVFYMTEEDDHPIAAVGINDPHTVSRIRRVIQQRSDITRRELEDPSFDLRRVLA